MFKRIAIYFICLLLLSIGALSLYRSSLTLKDMNVIKGVLLEKKIIFIQGARSGNYTLVLKIQYLDYKLGISYSSYKDAYGDSTMGPLNIMQIYIFYIDPTVPINKGVNCGLFKIEDSSGKQVYLASKKYDFWGGIIAILMSVFFYTLYKIGLKKDQRKINSNDKI